MDITDQVAGLREALAHAKYGRVSVDQRELEEVLDRVSALEAELKENVEDAKTLADFYSGCCLFAYLGRLASPAPQVPTIRMEELPPEFADVLEKHKWGLYARSDERPAPQVPDGYVLVPKEPTPKMVDATWDHDIDKNGGIESQSKRNRRIYAAMLSAAQAKEGKP